MLSGPNDLEAFTCLIAGSNGDMIRAADVHRADNASQIMNFKTTKNTHANGPPFFNYSSLHTCTKSASISVHGK